MVGFMDKNTERIAILEQTLQELYEAACAVEQEFGLPSTDSQKGLVSAIADTFPVLGEAYFNGLALEALEEHRAGLTEDWPLERPDPLGQYALSDGTYDIDAILKSKLIVDLGRLANTGKVWVMVGEVNAYYHPIDAAFRVNEPLPEGVKHYVDCLLKVYRQVESKKDNPE